MHSLSWSPDGNQLAIALYAAPAQVWDINLLSKIRQYALSSDEIKLLQKMKDSNIKVEQVLFERHGQCFTTEQAIEQGKVLTDIYYRDPKYFLDKNEKPVFDQLGSSDQELKDALQKALSHLIINIESRK